MIFGAISKALAQAGDPRFRGVLLRAVGLTMLLLAAFYVAFVWLVGWLVPDSLALPWIGEITFVDDLASGLAILGMLVLSVFLMVPVASAFTGFFLEEIADAVEARHYPQLVPADDIPFWDGLRDAARFLLIVILANLLALIVYLLSTVLAPVVFWLVNGYLLGVEYFQLVAMRRIGEREARRLRRRHMLTVWIAGTVMAIPLTVPVLNLVVPVIGVAAFTHIYHALAMRGAGQSPAP
ncbi:EI24 domain-containing protein [Rhodovulum sp. YNF3179]|uniref:EI24 domain-containing protein n=1 Tax=Rhodovulum sp. YNF3179 TaxID=3425127 RepID=UPI003D32A477